MRFRVLRARHVAVAVALCLTLVGGACGRDDDEGDEGDGAEVSLTTTDPCALVPQADIDAFLGFPAPVVTRQPLDLNGYLSGVAEAVGVEADVRGTGEACLFTDVDISDPDAQGMSIYVLEYTVGSPDFSAAIESGSQIDVSDRFGIAAVQSSTTHLVSVVVDDEHLVGAAAGGADEVDPERSLDAMAMVLEHLTD
jgi:hypothetical protein